MSGRVSVCSKWITLPNCWGWSGSSLVAQNDAQQRAVDLQLAIVFDEAQFPEFVYEETDARPGRADHLRERLLADLGRELRGPLRVKLDRSMR
jgi:hypothetical protein